MSNGIHISSKFCGRCLLQYTLGATESLGLQLLHLVSKNSNMQFESIPPFHWTQSNNVDRKRDRKLEKGFFLCTVRHIAWSLWVKKQTDAEKAAVDSSNLGQLWALRIRTPNSRGPLSPLNTPAVRQGGQGAEGALVKCFQESGGVERWGEAEGWLALRNTAYSRDTNRTERAGTSRAHNKYTFKMPDKNTGSTN